MSMSQKVREEMLPRLRQRYVGRGRQGRTRMIDELCEQFGYGRKHAIKLLNARTGWGGDPSVRKGRPPEYGVEVVEVLWRIWKVSEQPCGKRLVAMLELWLPHYEAEHGRLSPKVRKQLRAISAAQADRLLAPRKAQCKHRGRSGTKPGSLLKHHIPIRTDNWDITRPGWLEADTVAHCGGSLEGDFIWSVTYTDIFSGWTSLRAVWNKGAHGIVEATREVEAALPFAIEGFDCDNGSEFLNWHLVRYFQERPKRVVLLRAAPRRSPLRGSLRLAVSLRSAHPQPSLSQERQRPRRAEELDPCAPTAGLREAGRSRDGEGGQHALPRAVGAAAQLLLCLRQAGEQRPPRSEGQKAARPAHDTVRPAAGQRCRQRVEEGRAESRAQSAQSLRAQPAAGGSAAPVAAAGTSFQSPYGLLALRARSSNTERLTLGVITSEATIPSSRTLSGVIYF
jgi:hypothetical protein